MTQTIAQQLPRLRASIGESAPAGVAEIFLWEQRALTAQLKLGLDLKAVNPDGTPAIPMPTTLILDRDRIVQWVDAHPDLSRRSEPEQILASLDALARA